jgi:hypothetical protein
MSFAQWSNIVRLLPFVLAASAAAHEAERNSLILLVPHALPATSVDHGTAPTLARFRTEGVYFINSHSGFPNLTPPKSAPLSTGLNMGQLIAAAAADYSTALVDNTRVEVSLAVGTPPAAEESTNLSTIVNVLLPQFKEANRPFVLVYRFGEAEGVPMSFIESLGAENPGEDRFAGTASVRTADEALASIEGALKDLGLYETTNIVIAAEHGLSAIWKASGTSTTLKYSYKGVGEEQVPTGFLAIDLIAALQVEDAGLNLFDPDSGKKLLNWSKGQHPKRGNAIIAVDPSDPYATIVAKGGHDLIYLPEHLSKQEARHRAQLIVNELFQQDYVSGVFLDEKRVGRMHGALSLKHIGWEGDADWQAPAIVVNFVSVNAGCTHPTACTLVVADTPLSDGDDIAGAFSRADTWNFMAARGPDFQSRLISRAPASNADVVRTLGEVLRVGVGANDGLGLGGRVLAESLRGNEGKRAPMVRKQVVTSKSGPKDFMTEVHLQSVGGTMYFDAAGTAGWTVGVPEREPPVEWLPWRWDWSWVRKVTVSITPD